MMIDGGAIDWCGWVIVSSLRLASKSTRSMWWADCHRCKSWMIASSPRRTVEEVEDPRSSESYDCVSGLGYIWIPDSFSWAYRGLFSTDCYRKGKPGCFCTCWAKPMFLALSFVAFILPAHLWPVCRRCPRIYTIYLRKSKCMISLSLSLSASCRVKVRHSDLNRRLSSKALPSMLILLILVFFMSCFFRVMKPNKQVFKIDHLVSSFLWSLHQFGELAAVGPKFL